LLSPFQNPIPNPLEYSIELFSLLFKKLEDSTMNTLIEISVNVSPLKCQNPEKPKIQEKLEKWERPTPSKEDLIVRMKEANERREQLMFQTSKRASGRCNEVLFDLKSQQSIEGQVLEAKLTERTVKVAQNKAERTNALVKNLALKNKEKEKKTLQKKNSDQDGQQKLEEELNERIKAAVQRKKQIISENVVGKVSESLTKKSSQLNQMKKKDLDRVRDLQAMVASKLNAATARKQQALCEVTNNLSNIVKSKKERSMLVKNAEDANLSLSKIMLEKKLIKANERRENEIINRQVMSAEKNSAKFERSKEISRQLNFKARETRCKLENRMTSASQRKERLQTEENQKNEAMNRRRQRVLDKQTGMTSDAQKTAEILALETKLTEKAVKATQNKIDRTNMIVKSLAEKNKEKEVKILLKKENDQAGRQKLEVKIEEKIKAAEQRKDIINENFVGKVSESLTRKAMKVREVQKNYFDRIRNLDVTLNSKLNIAAERKRLLISESTQKLANSVRKKKEHNVMLRHSKEVDLSLSKMKMSNRLFDANERKENNDLNKQLMSAEKNYAKAERKKDIVRQREIEEMEARCRNENKMMIVTQRKESLKEQENQRNEIIKKRRGLVLNKQNIKETIEVQKVEEQISAKLNEATARRETLLLQKSAKKTPGSSIAAPQMNCLKSSSSLPVSSSPEIKLEWESPQLPEETSNLIVHVANNGKQSSAKKEDSPPPFHVQLQMLPIAMLSCFVNLFKNFFLKI